MKLTVNIVLLTAVNRAMALSLSELLSLTPELSNITANLARFDVTQNLETQVANITFLAPSNNAWSQFMSSNASSPSWNSDDELQSLLMLHFLGEAYDFQSWAKSSWVPTLLDTDISYGQALEVRRGVGATTIRGAFDSGARVVSQARKHDSGLLYIIDGVLLPPGDFAATATEADLTSFQAEFEDASMLQHIGVEGATIFAPNNDALQAVSDEIGNMTAQDLNALFSYHTVDGRIMYSSDLYQGTTLPTISFDGGVNQNLTISAIGNHFYVNAAKIIKPDILFKNGVMHIIDNVLNPKNQTVVPPDGVTQVAFGGAQPPGNTATPISDDISAPRSEASSGPSTAVLAGGIVSGIIGGFLMAGIAFFLWRRHRQSAQQLNTKQPPFDSEDSLDSGRRSDAGTPSTTSDPPLQSSWSKAELSGDDVERQQVFPKHELWTKSNVHEADTLGIGRGLAEMSGEGMDPHRKSQTSSVGHLSSTSPSRLDEVTSPISPSRSNEVWSPMSPMAVGGFR